MSNDLINWLSAKQNEWESRCRNCGACCGAFEDPCVHLHFGEKGKSSCLVYETRLGPQKTVSGQSFNCVNIREKFGQFWPGGQSCAYKIGVR